MLCLLGIVSSSHYYSLWPLFPYLLFCYSFNALSCFSALLLYSCYLFWLLLYFFVDCLYFCFLLLFSFLSFIVAIQQRRDGCCSCVACTRQLPLCSTVTRLAPVFFATVFFLFSLFYYLVAAAAVFASQSFFQICGFSFSFWQCFSFQLCQCFCCRCCCWSSAATLIRRHRTTLSQPLSI